MSRWEVPLNQSPILRALSSIRKNGARTLLMGGQACIFYGAAEFSRDVDLLVLLDPKNLDRLQNALNDLQAESVAVPPFESVHLRRGHAVHFRCRRADVAGLRIDLMSSPRGLPSFEEVWRRRTTIEVAGDQIDLLGLKDLVTAKKTQRDKDWPMIRRLVEQNYFANSENSDSQQVEFWLRELRTPDLLINVAARYPAVTRQTAPLRRAIQAALVRDVASVNRALEEEEQQERDADRVYWEPLRRELEELRRKKRESSSR